MSYRTRVTRGASSKMPPRRADFCWGHVFAILPFSSTLKRCILCTLLFNLVSINICRCKMNLFGFRFKLHVFFCWRCVSNLTALFSAILFRSIYLSTCVCPQHLLMRLSCPPQQTKNNISLRYRLPVAPFLAG